MLSIGVIIPTYSCEKADRISRLDYALWTLANQSIPPHQIVVVDDDSPDEYAEVISAIATKYRAIYMRLAYPGDKQYHLSHCFNAGRAILTTDIVLHTVDDMFYLDKESIQKIIFLYSNPNNELLVAHPDVIDLPKDSWKPQDITDFHGDTKYWTEQTTKYRYHNIDKVEHLSNKSQIIPINTPIGSGVFAVLRHKALDWDNKYINYGYEDVDISKSYLDNGYTSAIFSDIPAFHAHGPISYDSSISLVLNNFYYNSKWRER